MRSVPLELELIGLYITFQVRTSIIKSREIHKLRGSSCHSHSYLETLELKKYIMPSINKLASLRIPSPLAPNVLNSEPFPRASKHPGRQITRARDVNPNTINFYLICLQQIKKVLRAILSESDYHKLGLQLVSAQKWIKLGIFSHK